MVEDSEIGDPKIDPDYSLVIRFRSGDLLAFEALMQKYRQPIINLAGRILQDLHEAQDIMQNVFIRAYRALARFEFACKLSTWLYRITRNLCLNELRRRSGHRCSSLDEPRKDCWPPDLEDTCSRPAFEIVIFHEFNKQVEQALNSLPEPQRTAILLCVNQRKSYKDIAEILHISVPATRSLIHRGRRALKHKLIPYLSSGTPTTSVRMHKASRIEFCRSTLVGCADNRRHFAINGWNELCGSIVARLEAPKNIPDASAFQKSAARPGGPWTPKI